jgi:hypothetical protein
MRKFPAKIQPYGVRQFSLMGFGKYQVIETRMGQIQVYAFTHI